MTWKILAFFLISMNALAQDFETEAKFLATDLKTSLMQNLSEKVAKAGAPEAISFCHLNVKPIAKKAARDRIDKYEFGRTSHKIRNELNAPQAWAELYLKDFSEKFKGDIKKEFFIHKLSDGKQLYIEPLYMQAQCLLCHGENISKQVKTKLEEIYPHDKATGFKLNEFRGFIWIKEK